MYWLVYSRVCILCIIIIFSVLIVYTKFHNFEKFKKYIVEYRPIGALVRINYHNYYDYDIIVWLIGHVMSHDKPLHF